GEHGLAEEMTLAGLIVVPLEASERADYVVVGLDRFLTFAKLQRAFEEVRGGATFIATNKDPTYPMEEGREIPGGGSMGAASECAAGVTAAATGTRDAHARGEPLGRAAGGREEGAWVGARRDPDTGVGRGRGLTTPPPRPGVTPPAVLEATPPEE